MSAAPAKALSSITVEMVDVVIAVKINGLLHVWIDDRRKLAGIQSWRVRKINRWFIEYTLEGGAEITSDYDSEAKWTAVLNGLAAILVARGT